jgi:hypothetical protein
MITSLHANTSPASVATMAPAAPSAWLFEGERFQTRSGVPTFTMLRAMGSPMEPRPMNPTGFETVTVTTPPPASLHVPGGPPAGRIYRRCD